ncbi:MAG: sensor histidine kinase, partial [Chloroflexota bacterium]
MTARRADVASSHRVGKARQRIAGGRHIGRFFLRVRGFLGRHLSVRAKLTAWYGFMCALTLLLAGGAMYAYVSHQLSSQVDSGLIGTASSVNSELATQPPVPGSTGSVRGCNGEPHALVLLEVQDYCRYVKSVLTFGSTRLSKPGQFEQVVMDVSPRMSPVSIVPSGPGRSFVTGNADFFVYLMEAAGGQSLFGTSHYHGITYRVYRTPLHVPPKLARLGLGGALEVFQNENTFLAVDQTVLITLLVGTPLGLIIALLAGWLIARAALRPINRISRTVRTIGGSKDLSRRLDFVGPKDEVGRLAETFDDMMDRLESVFSNQKRFIADASHELRTPLTAIRGNADLMRIAPEEDREICLRAIRQESERMSRLVNDLLMLAEADVAEHPIQLGRVDLSRVVEEVYRATQVIAGDKVDVVLERVDQAMVEGDPDRLKQLLLNLADNAVKFTPAGGTVSLGLWIEGSEARLSVSDSGMGIAPEEKEAIFQRFYRVDQSR